MKHKGFGRLHPPQPTVLDLWESYLKNVVPADAEPIQIQETRRAFYGGAWMLLQTVKRLGDDDFTEDDGVEALEALEQEMKNFVLKVGKSC